MFNIGSIYYSKFTDSLMIYDKLTTPTSRIPHMTVVSQIVNNLNNTQDCKPKSHYMMINQTSRSHPNCVVATQYKNSSLNQVYTRASFTESFKTKGLYIPIEGELIRPELEANIKDARVI